MPVSMFAWWLALYCVYAFNLEPNLFLFAYWTASAYGPNYILHQFRALKHAFLPQSGTFTFNKVMYEINLAIILIETTQFPSLLTHTRECPLQTPTLS